MDDSRAFSHLVVIGASAGGVEALSELVSTLPEGFSAPILIAQHLDPGRESHLKEILERRSTLPVRTLEEHETLPLESGVVFVVPADRHVKITDSEIFLQEDTHGRPKPSVDLIFSSAAEMYGERLIAAVLTGTGSDGTDGARAVKKAGGTVVIQNPKTATYPGMPRSLSPNTVDVVAELDDIGPILHQLLDGIQIPAEPNEKKKLERFLEEVRAKNGIDFRSYKTPTIMRRLQRRIVATSSGNLDGYLEYLEDHPEEYQELVNTFLIKVTEFFRDQELFDFLREELIPELVKKASTQDNQIRIWSAGCATGEEAYSLAILVSEALRGESEHFNVRIFATDVDEAAVDFARLGIYSDSALSGLSEDLMDRYFTREDGNYQISKRVRGMIVFGQHDLAQRAPFPRIDLVFCRNVLIYFTQELQKRALQLFAYSLRDGGYLTLGKSESPSPLSEYFSLHDRHHKIYRRQGERFLMPPVSSTDPTPLPKIRSATGARPQSSFAALQNPAHARQARRGINGGWDEFLLRFPAGVAVVDRKYDIQSINAAARHLLSISEPAVGEDLLHLIRGAHYSELRAAIDTAFKEARSFTVTGLAVEEVTSGETRYLHVTCYPQREDGAVEAVIILVEDITDLWRSRHELEKQLETASDELEKVRREMQAECARQEALNQRLIQTNRQLAEANQELTSINEELQATNEQYLVTNEETQAATEEVETLNEELQATNEELETLNEELQATIEELNTTNEDLHSRSIELQEFIVMSEEEQGNIRSLLESLPDAVLAVDGNGKVLFANSTFQETFGATEEGASSLQNFASRDANGEPLPMEETPQRRAARGESFRAEIFARTSNDDERRFETIGRPLRNGERHGGIVIVREVAE